MAANWATVDSYFTAIQQIIYQWHIVFGAVLSSEVSF